MNSALDVNDEDGKKGENKKEGFKVAFRRRLFQIYFELMKERNTDWIFAGVMIFIMFLQMYGILYSSKINFPFKDDLYTSIYNLSDLIRIYPLLENAQSDVYYFIAAYGLIFILLVYILMIIYIDYSLKIDKFYFIFPLKLMMYMSSFIYWILMHPIVEIFISIFSCSNGTHVVVTSLVCWSGIHIFYCALFSVFLILYICIFLLISFFYNESRPYHTDSFARLDTNFETYLTLYRVSIIIKGHFLTQSKLQWLIIVIHILGSANFCKMYLKYLPYYNSKTSIMFGSGWFIYFWISINILLTKALENLDYQGQSIVILIGIVLIFPATKQIREQKIQNKIFNKKHDKIKSEYELDIFIHKIYRLIIDQHVNEVDEMILLGVVHNHQSECLNQECPLNNDDELYLPRDNSFSDRKSVLSKDTILLYHLINSIYAEYAKNSNSAAVLHTTYAYFLFSQIGNIHAALLELNVADKCDTNYQQKFTIYRSKRFIEDHLVHQFSKNKDMPGKQTFADLDVTIVITFEALFAKLNKEIEKSANDHIEFWSHLDSQMVDLNVLHKLGLNIITNTKKINEFWHQLIKINPKYPKALQLYGTYLDKIKNDGGEGEELIKQAQDIARPKSLNEHIDDFEMMFAEDTAIVVISGNKDSQSKIMKTNNGITRLFGYNTFEVHGHEVNILMPPIIGVKHNYFLDSFFKTGRERVINNGLDTFAMLRVGHIFSVQLIVKPVPSLKNDIQYIGLIKPTNRDYDFILTDQYGRIDSISKGITAMLQLSANFFKENEIFIQVLCPQLCEVERIKGSKQYATKFEQWNGIKDLVFIIPKNFSNITQKQGGRVGVGMQNLNNSNINIPDDDTSKREGAFVGLKSPDHLKKVCNMFRNQDHKDQPKEYLKMLLQNINYEYPDILKGPIRTEILNKSHGNGHLKMKVFQILNPKRNGSQGDSDRGHNTSGDNNMKALIEETNKKLEHLTSEQLSNKILLMKQLQIQLKKGVRFANTKQKNMNIQTPINYEKAELQRYAEQIKQFEVKCKEIKAKEELQALEGAQNEERKEQEDQDLQDQVLSEIENSPGLKPLKQNRIGPNFMLGQGLIFNQQVDLMKETPTGASPMNINFQQLKSTYPLRENDRKGNTGDMLDMSIPSLNQNNQNDMSESYVVQDRLIAGMNKEDIGVDFSQMESGPDQVSNNNTKDLNAQLLYQIQQENMENERKDRIRDIDKVKYKNDDTDLLKDLRNKNKKVKKEDGKEGEEGEGGEVGGAEQTGDGAEDGEKKMFMDDTGSVASSTKSLMKHLRMLRNALYENYAPPSIKNLKIIAKFVFLALVVIAISWYVYIGQIYKKLDDNVTNIYSSKNRINSLASIGSDVRGIWSVSQGLIARIRGGQDYITTRQTELNTTAQSIQESQNNLSTSYLNSIYTDESLTMINPTNVELIYNSPISLPMIYDTEIWSTMMDVAVHAYLIMDIPFQNVTTSLTSGFFLMQNCLNNILESIYNSTSAILNESYNISGNVKNTLSIMLYTISASLFISICIIFPVATKVDKNKDELLRHFMLIDRDDVKSQLEKCRVFFNTMHDKDPTTQQNNEVEEEEFKDDEEEGDDQEDKHKKSRQRSRKNKMHKKFSTSFISLIIKFLVVITILEGYFVLCFFQADSFLMTANSLINEYGNVTLRQFSNNFLYQIMQEALTTNGTSFVMNQPSLPYMFTYLNMTIQQQENFLQLHSNNQGSHSTVFNSFFSALIYDNVCTALWPDNSTDINKNCSSFMGGILQKGLYSANVAYWDNLRSLTTDFNNSVRSLSFIKSTLNSPTLIQNEQLKDIYFSVSFTQLLDQLYLSIQYNFDTKNKDDTILFACYLVILFLLYFILWRKFIEATRHSLWVTKSMLAIIPLEIIQKVPKIKDFLLASSKNTFSVFNN